MELKQRRREVQKKYYERRGRETSKRYYQKHREETIARSKRYAQTHREQRRISGLRYYHSHKEQVRTYFKMVTSNLKAEVLTHYGNGKLVCIKCGFGDIKALTLDHIGGGGNKHREEVKLVGYRFYLRLKRHNFPMGYQTLCMNCQFIKKVDEGEHRWRLGLNN